MIPLYALACLNLLKNLKTPSPNEIFLTSLWHSLSLSLSSPSPPAPGGLAYSYLIKKRDFDIFVVV